MLRRESRFNTLPLTKSVVADRKKTLNHDISKTAGASAKEIKKLMADQGWIKLSDKGEVVP